MVKYAMEKCAQALAMFEEACKYLDEVIKDTTDGKLAVCSAQCTSRIQLHQPLGTASDEAMDLLIDLVDGGELTKTFEDDKTTHFDFTICGMPCCIVIVWGSND